MKNQGDDYGQLKELLEIIRDKIDKLEMFQHVTSEQVRTIKDQMSVVNRKLDTHSGSLVSIESKLDRKTLKDWIQDYPLLKIN